MDVAIPILPRKTPSCTKFFVSYALRMEKSTLAILVTIGFSVVGVIGDYFLKRASDSAHSLRTVGFTSG